MTDILKKELARMFAAMDKLDEYYDVLLQDKSGIFLNYITFVICFTIMDKTEDGTFVNRVIPILRSKQGGYYEKEIHTHYRNCYN